MIQFATPVSVRESPIPDLAQVLSQGSEASTSLSITDEAGNLSEVSDFYLAQQMIDNDKTYSSIIRGKSQSYQVSVDGQIDGSLVIAPAEFDLIESPYPSQDVTYHKLTLPFTTGTLAIRETLPIVPRLVLTVDPNLIGVVQNTHNIDLTGMTIVNPQVGNYAIHIPSISTVLSFTLTCLESQPFFFTRVSTGVIDFNCYDPLNGFQPTDSWSRVQIIIDCIPL